MADWEGHFAEKLKPLSKGIVASEPLSEEDILKHADRIFDLFEKTARAINDKVGETAVSVYRSTGEITISIKHYYLTASLKPGGKLMFVSNGSILPFTRASLTSEGGRLVWAYRDLAKGSMVELTKDGIRDLYDDAFRMV